MKLKITMELEIGDLTDEQRAELEDDLNSVSYTHLTLPTSRLV